MFGEIWTCTVYIAAGCHETMPVIKLSLTLSGNFLVDVIIPNLKKDISKSAKRVTKTKYR